VDLAGPYVKLLQVCGHGSKQHMKQPLELVQCELLLVQSRFHAPSFADAWIMQPTPAAGLEVRPSFTTQRCRLWPTN